MKSFDTDLFMRVLKTTQLKQERKHKTEFVKRVSKRQVKVGNSQVKA